MWRAGTAETTETAEKFIIILMILCFAVVSFVSVVSVVSVVSTQTFTKPHYPNFLREVVRCGASRKKPSRDSTLQVQPWMVYFLGCAADCGLSREIISCQKGSDLFYRKRRSPRDSTSSTARGVLLLGWDKDVPLITRNSQEIKRYSYE